MQLSFNPLDPAECNAIQMVIAVLVNANHPKNEGTHGMTPIQPVDAALLNAKHGTPGAPVVAIVADNGQDQRDPAAAFGASAAPLGVAPSTAVATPSANVPAGLPAGLPMPQLGIPAGALPLGATASAGPANATPAASPANTVDLDSTGLPWDGRIHASTKSKKADGTWTKLRGFNDEAKYNAIVSELRAALALPPAGAVFTPPAGTNPVVVPIVGAGGGGGPLAAAAPSAAPVTLPGMNGPASSAAPAQPAATLQPASAPQNFDELMPRITAAQTAQQIPAGALEAALAAFQLPGVIALVSRPDYVPHVWDYLKKTYPTLA